MSRLPGETPASRSIRAMTQRILAQQDQERQIELQEQALERQSEREIEQTKRMQKILSGIRAEEKRADIMRDLEFAKQTREEQGKSLMQQLGIKEKFDIRSGARAAKAEEEALKQQIQLEQVKGFAKIPSETVSQLGRIADTIVEQLFRRGREKAEQEAVSEEKELTRKHELAKIRATGEEVRKTQAEKGKFTSAQISSFIKERTELDVLLRNVLGGEGVVADTDVVVPAKLQAIVGAKVIDAGDEAALANIQSRIKLLDANIEGKATEPAEPAKPPEPAPGVEERLRKEATEEDLEAKAVKDALKKAGIASSLFE